MTFEYASAHRFQVLGYLRSLEIASSNMEVLPKRQQDLGDTAHADAADANKVNVSRPSE
jgi:hypothetical protein